MMMRQALRPNVARRQVAGPPKPIPAPTKGWYALENDMDMPRGSAKVLRNWWPEPDSVTLRRGLKEHASGMQAVWSLMAYRAAADSKMFAVDEDGVFDVTAGGAVGARVRIMTEPRVSHVNVATSGDHFLIVVNGADAPTKFNGTSWTAISVASGGPATINDLNFVFQYRSRLFFLAKDSTQFYFLPADSVGGSLGVFEVGASLSRGGKLIAGATWSIDSGNGPDDLMVVVSDQGQIVVYRGTNPADSTAWERIGAYSAGKPVGSRCLKDLGGEIIYLCDDGAIPLSSIVKFDRAGQKKGAATANIAKAINEAIRERGRGPEWMISGWSAGSMLICNLPAIAQGAEQYCMNTQHGAWTNFTGVDATCWEEFGDFVYCGTPDGRVMKFWHGSTDDGEPIEAMMVPAFSQFNYAGVKTASLLRSELFTSDELVVKIGLAVDYDIDEQALAELDFDAPAAMWDVATWDVDEWAGDDVIRRQAWQGVSGVGYAFAPVLAVETPPVGPDYQIDCRVIAFSLVMANGGVL